MSKDETMHATPQKKLRDLLKLGRSTQQNINELSGTFGEKIAAAIEKDYLNRRAFNIVRALDRLEPEKLADTLDHLEHYLDISGLNERAASAPRMGLEEKTELEADEEEQDRAASRAKNGAAKSAASDAAPKPGNAAPAGDGNVKNFPTPQGRA